MSDATSPSRPGFLGSIFSGHVYQITDPAIFFSPILSGQQGYEPWPGPEVRMWSVNDLLPIPMLV